MSPGFPSLSLWVMNLNRIGVQNRIVKLAFLIIGGSAFGLGAAATLVALQVPKVGSQTDKGILVNTGQYIDPDGKLTLFSARPVDVVLSPDGRIAYLKENDGLTVVDTASGVIQQRLPIPGGSSHTGLALAQDATKLYYSNAGSEIAEIDIASTPRKILRTFKMPNARAGGNAYPCGMTVHEGKLYVALSRSNQVAEISLASGEILRTIEVAPAPFAIALDANNREIWVTSWGTTPKTGDLAAPSSGTPVTVDRRGIATGGVASQISLSNGRVVRTIPVGSQPCEIALSGGSIYVASANSDAIHAIARGQDTSKVVWKSTLGAAPSSLEILDNGQIAVACGGSNEVVILDRSTHKPLETYRSAWYPLAVRSFRNNLFIAGAKGVGARGNDLRQGKLDAIAKTEKFATPLTADAAKQRGVYQFTGALSIIPRDPKTTAKPEALAAIPAARKGLKPVPIPTRPGEPSVFKHVIYVLKENRTYDQIFGDIAKGDGDPSLCIYGDKITPNHHALANEFVLLDNYYCNGVLSADGHSWSTEGNATTYFERSFGGWTRSYPFGDDPLAISSTGHIWDAVLDKGLTFKNYGEYDYTEPANGEKHTAILNDFQSGARKIKFTHKIGIDRLRKHSDPECPGWNMEIPDILRASYFLRDLKAANTSGKLPNFNFVYLPQDHTSGAGAGVPHPTAHMADNDLALGQIVDAVSRSRFWKETVIFVIEDDPQAGFDHVDGHRSICLVISPYTKRGAVVSKFYNQASVLKSIRHIFGIKPATRFEMIANLMSDCFQSVPNLKPYTVRPNQVPLDRMNGSDSKFPVLDMSKPDIVDEDEFNRQHWASSRGDAPYPKEWAGAHGRGLKAKGLAIDEGVKEDDD